VIDLGVSSAGGPEDPVPINRLIERTQRGVVLAGVVVLPLIFVPSLDDGYALPKVQALRVIGLVGAALFVGYVIVGGALTRHANPWTDVPLLFFGGLLVAASMTSVDPIQSLAGEAYQYQGLTTLSVYLGSFYVARLTFGSRASFQMLLGTIVGTGTIVAVYAIAQRLGLDPFWPGPPDSRVISSIGQPNDLAAYLDLVIVAAAGLWPAAGKKARITLGAVVVVVLVALALTFSRGGYLALVVAVIVLALPRARMASRRRAGGIALAMIAGVVAVGVALPVTRGLVESVVNRAVETTDLGEGSIRFHLDLWRVGSVIALDHPLLGTGPETFPLVFRPYLDEVLPADRARLLNRFRLESPHNELIGVAAEMGLPALAAYVAFLGSVARVSARQVRDASSERRSIALVVLATLAVHVTTTFFMTPEVSTSELFWVTMGAGLASVGDAT
jgi:O-antigen ligase